MEYRGLITTEPERRGGKPCIRGLRITVYGILEYLTLGMSEDAGRSLRRDEHPLMRTAGCTARDSVSHV